MNETSQLPEEPPAEKRPSSQHDLAQLKEFFPPPWYLFDSDFLLRWWYSRLLAAEAGLVGRVYSLSKKGEQGLPPGAPEELARARIALAGIPNKPTAYDAVWSAVHEIRHANCQHSEDPAQLIMAAGDIRADLEYHGDKKFWLRKLDAIVDELTELSDDSAAHHRKAKRKKIVELQRGLTQLSKIAAEERESMWRKVNRVMARRKRAAYVLVILSVALIVAFPLLFDEVDISECCEWAKRCAWYLLIAVCGAIGGLLSGLQRRDAIELSSVDHRLEQLAFKLRPKIGSVAALVMVLSLHAGGVNMVRPYDEDPNEGESSEADTDSDIGNAVGATDTPHAGSDTSGEADATTSEGGEDSEAEVEAESLDEAESELLASADVAPESDIDDETDTTGSVGSDADAALDPPQAPPDSRAESDTGDEAAATASEGSDADAKSDTNDGADEGSGDGSGGLPKSPALILLLAISAGLSERLLLGRVEKGAF